MARKFGIVAMALGAFLLVLAALSKFYMYDRLAVVPLNQNTTSISETADGADAEYLDVANGVVVTTGPLRSVRLTTGDIDLSKEASDELNQDVAVWNTYVCTAPKTFDCSSGDTPLSASNDVVAFDRHTGEAVKWAGAVSEEDGKETENPFSGLYFKFPFNTQKKSYDFWDGTLMKATPAEFVKESSIDGLKVYEFKQTIPATKTGSTDVPGDLVGESASTVSADRIYSNVRTLFVEPVTGAIIKGGESQDSWLEVGGERRATTTTATLGYTDAYVKENVADYKTLSGLLNAVQTTIPLIGAILGLALIALGALLVGRRTKGEAEDTHVKETVGV